MGITSTSAECVSAAAVVFMVLAKGVPHFLGKHLSKGLQFGSKCRLGKQESEVEIALAFHPGAVCSEMADLKQSKRSHFNFRNM